MRPALLLALLALAAAPAGADDFATRVARAKASAATPAGYAYDMALVPAVHAAMTACVPPGRRPARKDDVFTAVADVDAVGGVHGVAVRPTSAVSRCFADRLAATRLQPPPRSRGSVRHPIVIELRESF